MTEPDETTDTPGPGASVLLFAVFAALAALAMGALLGARFGLTDED